MSKEKYNLKSLIEELTKSRIIKSIGKIVSFCDEPTFHFYAALLFNTGRYSNEKFYIETTAGGISFVSKREALMKCLGESMERFCQFCYRKKKIIYSSFENMKTYSLNPGLINHSNDIEKQVIGWIKGFSLSKNIQCFLPAQLVYLNYKKAKGEPALLFPIISTGAAGGFDPISTLLRGIYEVIERDAFMSIYLNKISAPRIDLNGFKNNTIQRILQACKRYKLEVLVFDITTNIAIPSFLSIVIDKSSVGSPLACGAKSSLNSQEALVGSVVESFMSRSIMRAEMFKHKMNFSKPRPNQINSGVQRSVYWSHPNMLKRLDFLLEQKSSTILFVLPVKTKEEELKIVKNILLKAGFEIFYADITIPLFRRLGYFVYKAIIPGLQPLYMNEANKVLNINRLKYISSFFGQKKFIINTTPHPFP